MVIYGRAVRVYIIYTSYNLLVLHAEGAAAMRVNTNNMFENCNKSPQLFITDVIKNTRRFICYCMDQYYITLYCTTLNIITI